jgi:thiosulfate/3-mercaptopyruvate sulfurtransferase
MMRIGKIVFNLVVCGLFVVGCSNSASTKNKFEKEVDNEQAAVKLVREVQQGGYNVITAKELKDLIGSGKDLLVIDTMPYDASYKKAHVPGAKQFLFPIPEMTEWNTKETGGKTLDDYQALLGPDKDKTIVVYCGFVKCTRSHNGAMWAVKLGYKNVLRFPGGIFAWQGAGYPTEKAG